jgi:hypothetical protein
MRAVERASVRRNVEQCRLNHCGQRTNWDFDLLPSDCAFTKFQAGPSNFPGQKQFKKRNVGKMKGRITVRLSDGEMERLRGFCRQTDTDISHAVIQALNALLSPKEDRTTRTGPPPHLFPPEQILTTIPKYLAWGSNDARPELKRQFAELLACSFALKRTFPRTPGIREVYEALRPLCRHFGMD